MVAGSFGAGDRLGVQRQGPGRVDGADDHEIAHQAPGQQHVVAEPPGPLDRFLPEREPCLQLAGEVIRAAQCRQGSAEQPLVAQLAGDLDRLFSKLPCRGEVNEGSDDRSGDQCRGEQRGVGVGVGPPEHRHEQPEGLLLPVSGPTSSATERDAQAQHHRGPVRPAGRMPGGAPQVGLVGVQPGQPAALLRPGQIRRRRPRPQPGNARSAPRRPRRPQPRRPRPAARRRTAGSSPAAGTAGLPRLVRPRPGSCPPATRADPRHPARPGHRTRTPPRRHPGRSRRRTPTGGASSTCSAPVSSE